MSTKALCLSARCSKPSAKALLQGLPNRPQGFPKASTKALPPRAALSKVSTKALPLSAKLLKMSTRALPLRAKLSKVSTKCLSKRFIQTFLVCWRCSTEKVHLLAFVPSRCFVQVLLSDRSSMTCLSKRFVQRFLPRGSYWQFLLDVSFFFVHCTKAL